MGDRVTIGLPVFNGERFLAEQLDSLLNQTYQDFVLHIADNASTDATEEICRDYERRDQRIVYDRHDENLGAAPNVNFLIRACETPYFKLAAHDDWHAGTYLERCVAPLEEDPSVVLCHSLTTLIDAEGRPCRVSPDGRTAIDFTGRHWPIDSVDRRLDSPRPAHRYHAIAHQTVLVGEIWGVMRLEALLRTALFGRYFGSDRPMLAELALMGRIVVVPEPLFSLRLHGTHATRQSWRTRAERVDPSVPRRVQRFTGLQAYRDFGKAVVRADLPVRDRMGASLSWLTLPANPRVVQKLLVPGPFNFFGIQRPSWWPQRELSSEVDDAAIRLGDSLVTGEARLTIGAVLQRRWTRTAIAVTEQGERRFVKQHRTLHHEYRPRQLEIEVAANQLLDARGTRFSVPRIISVDRPRSAVVYEWLPIDSPHRLLRRNPRAFNGYWNQLVSLLPDAVVELSTMGRDLGELPVRYSGDAESADALCFEGLEVGNLAVCSDDDGLPHLVVLATGEPYRTIVDDLVARLVVSSAFLNWGRPLHRMLRGPAHEPTRELVARLPPVSAGALLSELDAACQRYFDVIPRGQHLSDRVIARLRMAAGFVYRRRTQRLLVKLATGTEDDRPSMSVDAERSRSWPSAAQGEESDRTLPEATGTTSAVEAIDGGSRD